MERREKAAERCLEDQFPTGLTPEILVSVQIRTGILTQLRFFKETCSLIWLFRSVMTNKVESTFEYNKLNTIKIN
jgi:hypothetical protein